MYCRFTNFMFLLDDFIMTTGQQTNLKFLVRFGKSPAEALCMLQHVYKEQSLSRSTVFHGTKDSKKDVRMLRMVPGVEPSLCISRSSVILCQMLFRFNLSSYEISCTLNRPSPRTIFFTSSTLLSFLFVEGLPHLGSFFTSSRPSLNLLCQRKTVERDKLCSL